MDVISSRLYRAGLEFAHSIFIILVDEILPGEIASITVWRRIRLDIFVDEFDRAVRHRDVNTANVHAGCSVSC